MELEEENVELENESAEEVESHIDDLDEESEDSEWTPDYTFDVKGEKMEFDEEFRGAITSKEAENKLRDLYTKAVGLDGVKQRLTTYESNNSELNETVNMLTDGYKNLKGTIEKNDIDGLISSLGVSKNEEFQDAILEWAIKKADFLTLPQEEQKQISTQLDRDSELSSLRSELNSIKEQNNRSSVEAELGKMRNIISSDKWSGLESSLKEIGISLEDEAISIGTNQYRTTGAEPTIEEAVEMAAKKYALFFKNNNNNTSVDSVEGSVLPRVKRSSQSSVSTSLKSIDDLKKLAASMGI